MDKNPGEKETANQSESERLTALSKALKEDVAALALKHKLSSVICVVGVSTDGGIGTQWTLTTSGSNAPMEMMAAWALGQLTARRQEFVREMFERCAHITK